MNFGSSSPAFAGSVILILSQHGRVICSMGPFGSVPSGTVSCNSPKTGIVRPSRGPPRRWPPFGLSRLGPGHERRYAVGLGRHLDRHAVGLDLGIGGPPVPHRPAERLLGRHRCCTKRSVDLGDPSTWSDHPDVAQFPQSAAPISFSGILPTRLGEGRLGRCQGGVRRCPVRR